MSAERSRILKQIMYVNYDAYEYILRDYIENGTTYDEELLLKIWQTLLEKKENKEN